MTETFINHCIKFYQTLDERATDRDLESGGQARIFVGSIVEAYASTGISQAYYSPIRKALERHECILVIQRGGRDLDTVIQLKGLPSNGEWNIDGWDDRSGLTKTARYATLAAEVREIKESLGGINVTKALIVVEERLEKIESELAKLTELATSKTTPQQQKDYKPQEDILKEIENG